MYNPQIYASYDHSKNSPLWKRAITVSLKTALKDTPVVSILGARQSGKSTLASALCPHYAYVNLDEEKFLSIALSDPSGFIETLPERVIIDEVQRAPSLLRAIKASVDKNRRPGRFVLTGSANLLMLPQLSESLAGRMEVVELYPLTESEKEEHPGKFLHSFLKGKLKPEMVISKKEKSPTLVERLIAGGYPEPLIRSPVRARQWHRQYIKSILERDVHSIADVKDVRSLKILLELLALSPAQLVNVSQLSNGLKLDRATVDHYLSILERLFLIRMLPAWHNNDGKRLLKTPKVHLLDSGLAAALAGLRPHDWIVRREKFGHLLESFVVQQLIAQATWTDPDLRFWHYRDHDQVEVDLVITRGKETWGVEVKSAASTTPEDGKGLRRLADRRGEHFRGGIVFYAGDLLVRRKEKKMFSVPLEKLWNC